MKRRTICVSAMVLWLLVFSTVFSFWVEQTMAPIVTECRPYTAQDSTEPRLDLDCLFAGEDGAPVLYQIFDGLGWESGPRIKSAAPSSYEILDSYIVYFGQEPVIQYSTKELRPGEKAIAADKAGSRKETYLGLCPTSHLRDDLPENLTVLAQTEGAVLAEELQAPSTFMPKRAVGELFQRQPFALPAEKVYSLVDVEGFFNALPLAALLPSMVLFVLILWVSSFPLLKDLRKNRSRLIMNASLAAAALVVLPVLLNFLRLPPSLLPGDNIADISHYMEEFSEIFESLSIFADAGVSAAQGVLSGAYTMVCISLGIIIISGAAALTIAGKSFRNLQQKS